MQIDVIFQFATLDAIHVVWHTEKRTEREGQTDRLTTVRETDRQLQIHINIECAVAILELQSIRTNPLLIKLVQK